MVKQNNSKKSKENSKKNSTMTNRGQYRTRKCLNDTQKIEYDKVKTAIIGSWQMANNHGSYKSAAIREQHLINFMQQITQINGEPIELYKKLLMGVLKDQARSNKVLREPSKTSHHHPPAKFMFDGLADNDEDDNDETRANPLEDFAKTAKLQIWAKNLPDNYWEKALQDDDMKGLEQYFDDVTDTVREGLAILLAQHHQTVAHLEDKLRIVESQLEHVKEDNNALKTQLSDYQTLISKVNALTTVKSQKLSWWCNKLNWFLDQQKAVGGYKDTTLNNTRQYVTGWLNFLAKKGLTGREDPE